MLSESDSELHRKRYNSRDLKKNTVLTLLATRHDYGASLQDIQNEFIRRYAWATEYTKGLKQCLDDLEKTGCVKCYNYNKRTRIYKITQIGIEALDVINKNREKLNFLDCFRNLDLNIGMSR